MKLLHHDATAWVPAHDHRLHVVDKRPALDLSNTLQVS
jgi:hypothetical protein